jgi:ABC-type Zn uptake system ZnuABC Zn-binding protein ZnuA
VLLAVLGSGVLEVADAESQYACPGKKNPWLKPIQIVTEVPPLSDASVQVTGAVLVGGVHVTPVGTEPHAAPMPVTQ